MQVAKSNKHSALRSLPRHRTRRSPGVNLCPWEFEGSEAKARGRRGLPRCDMKDLCATKHTARKASGSACRKHVSSLDYYFSSTFGLSPLISLHLLIQGLLTLKAVRLLCSNQSLKSDSRLKPLCLRRLISLLSTRESRL